ncbi:MAG: undecaprenyl/decaprenyl-phosphate alpha-N-acetylglucosaminyl 1-phosphate transferase [Acidimicrobiia bacterium]|nr:undecaprenyl/decaprenyl-phosphate alpha-N-acetylglucosaminyl 1-phosphate transferase [Acidimicrobiia bacterium]
MPSIGAYATVLAAVVATTFASLFAIRRLAVRIGAVVRPDDRHVHERPTPTLGGLAMVLGVLVGMGVARLLGAFDPVFAGSTEPVGVILALVVIAFVGMIDDLRDVSAPAKMAGIVLAASILVIAGISILVLRVPFAGVFVLSNDWSYLLSVVWVVGLTNAINLIDGLDGLAAGIVAIAAATFFLYARELGADGLLVAGNIGPLLAVLVLGACLGFLPHNVHPARIFMGDVGALSLGLLMAASTMVVGGRTDRAFSGNSFFFFAPLLIPVVILGVPVVDTLFAIIRRARSRTGISNADKGHLHHRLMRLGHGHRRSVFILWTWTALLSGFVLWPIYSGSGDGIVPFGIAAILLSLFTLFHPGLRIERRRHAADDAAAPVADDTPTEVAGEPPRA